MAVASQRRLRLRLSGFGDQIERAHLCPRSEVE